MSIKAVIHAGSLLFMIWFSTSSQTTEITPLKMNIAVLTLKNADGVTSGEAEIISDRLRAELFNTGSVNIMERTEMKTIMQEQGFQQSGACSTEECIVEIGRILGVQKLVAGSIGKVGSLYLLNLRLIDVMTGRVSKVISRDMYGMDVVVTNLRSVSAELVGSGKVAAPPSAPREPVLKVVRGTDTSEVHVNEYATQTTPVPETVAQPAVTPVVSPAPETTPAPTTPPPKTIPAVKAEQPAQVDLNQNTADDHYRPVVIGINIGFSARIGATELELTDRSPSLFFSDGFNEVISAPVLIPGISLVMHIARYLSIDAGIGVGIWKQEFHKVFSIYTLDLTENYRMISGLFGIGASIPVTKLRFNAGIRGGVCLLKNTEDGTVRSGSTSSEGYLYEIETDVFAPSIGGRAGIEFIPAKHLGISINFTGMYTRFTDASVTYDGETWSRSTYRETLEITLPMLGAEGGVTFYF